MLKKILGAVFLLGVFAESAICGAGDLDPTFDGDGVVLTAVANASVNEVAEIIIQPDGKLLAAIRSNGTSADMNVARYNANGSLDTSFSSDGVATSPFGSEFDQINALALQTDGKILAVGRLGISPAQFVILRFNADGTPDTSFDGDGIVTTSVLSSGTAISVAVQTDGKIVVGGNASNSAFEDFFAFIRYNANGSLDTSFGAAGTFFVNIGLIDLFEDLIIQPDGKILGVGTGNVSSNNPLLTIIRLLPNGSFDASFDGDGRLTRPFSVEDDEAVAIELQPDGKILIGGRSGGSFTVFRFLAGGALDTSFDGDGISVADLGIFSRLTDLKIQADGKIVTGGGVFVINTGISMEFVLVRFNSNGSLDQNFGTNGIVTTALSNNDDFINSLALQPDGKILAAGISGEISAQKATLIRYSGSSARTKFDFDGDGRADISIFRPNGGQWWLNQSRDGLIVHTFGNSSDKLTPADFTGDGRADVAVFRPATGEWFVLRSDNFTYYAFPFGTNGDMPLPNDFDGDGRADAAVFRPSNATWFIQLSSGGTMIETFGINGDVPTPADYDGDGKTDPAVFRPSAGQWWLNRSTAGLIVATFGTATDRLVPGDYTGDGRADIAVWRPSTGEWLILRSENSTFFAFPFGGSGDLPSPADYDGDGKSDAAVFRPSEASWYLRRSTSGVLIEQFGTSTDLPIPSTLFFP